MTPEQHEMVRHTFVMMSGRKIEAGRLFYDRLFAIAPETKSMFRVDMDAQARKLMDMLALAIGSLHNMRSLVLILESMAARHVAYGVRDEDYDKVGEALLWTLEQVLGAAFTPHVRTAWTALYGTIAKIMREAAHSPPARTVADGAG